MSEKPEALADRLDDERMNLIERLADENERLHDELRQSSIDITRAEVERLREALALAERLAAGRLAMVEQLAGEVEALRRDADRLWEALKHYGKHDDDCGDHDAYNSESLRHCGCGLDAVLDETLGEKR